MMQEEPNFVEVFWDLAGDWALELNRDNQIVHYRQSHSQLQNDPDFDPAVLPGGDVFKLLPEECGPDLRNLLAGFSADSNTQPGQVQTRFCRDNNGQIYSLRALPKYVGKAYTGCDLLVRRIPPEELVLLDRLRSAAEEAGLTAQAAMASERTQMLDALAFGLASASGESLEQILHRALKDLGNFLDLDRCLIFQQISADNSCALICEWRRPGLLLGPAPVRHLPEEDLRQSNADSPVCTRMVVNDTAADSAYAAWQEAGIGAFADLPLLVNGKLWGCLCIESTLARSWNPGDQQLIGSVAGLIAGALAQNQARHELDLAYSTLRGIVHNYPGIICSADAENRITLFEGQGVRNLPHVERVLNQQGLEALYEVLDPKVKEYVRRTYELGPQHFDLESGGRFLSCRTNLLYDAAGRVVGVVGAGLDVTDMHKMQLKLQKAVFAAEEASRAKSDFLSRMSHEIRTPMNAIIGMQTISQNYDDVDKLRYCLERIGTASHQLLGIINDILDMSKIEANRFEIVAVEFDFEVMLQKVVTMITPKLEEKQQEFSFKLGFLPERKVVGDDLRLTQVLLNLLSNAVKFTPDQGIISLSLEKESLDSQDPDPGFMLRVSIQDNGIGLDNEQKSRLFHSFEQADGTISRRYGGTGLGLAISQKIISLMGGEIQVESRPNQGATFSFSIPLQWGGPLQSPLKTLPAKDMRILVVDDSEDVRIYFKTVLRKFKLNCDTAGSGEEAIFKVRQRLEEGCPYDVIFLDWQMPGLDGGVTAKRIREIMNDNVIVIMISVADWSEIEEKVRKIGITRFLPKPIFPSTLFNTLAELTASGLNPIQECEFTPDDWSDKTLLIAEDIEINQEIVAEILSGTKIKLDFANNGREAVNKFTANQDLYDAILMDVQMPEMDGLSATRAIRALKTRRARQVPILAMTANAFKEDIFQCLSAGMNDHVAKPINIEELLGKLQNLLKEGS